MRELKEYRGDAEDVILPDEIDRIAENVFLAKRLTSLECSGPLLQTMFRSLTRLVSSSVRVLRVRPSGSLLLFPDRLKDFFPALEEIRFLESSAPDDIISLNFDSAFAGGVRVISFSVTSAVCRQDDAGNFLMRFPRTDPMNVSPCLRYALIRGYLSAPGEYDEGMQEIYGSFLKDHGAQFFKKGILQGYGDLLESYLSMYSDQRLFRPATLDIFLNLADSVGSTSLKAALIAHKTRHYDLTRLQAAREKRDEEMLMNPTGRRAMRKIWGWKNDGNGGLIITRYLGGEQDVPDVPRSIEGSPVTRIANGLFRKTVATRFTIPENVQSIGERLFDGNVAAGEVIIRAPLRTLPSATFRGCMTLSHVELPETIASIGANAFEDCQALDLVLPSSVRHIGPSAFERALCLHRVSLQNAYLSPYAFAESGLEELILPGCFRVPDGLCSDVGRKMTLVDIRDACSIGAEAFFHTAIQTLHISGLLHDIGENAFAGCRITRLIVHGTPVPDSVLRKLPRAESIEYLDV